MSAAVLTRRRSDALGGLSLGAPSLPSVNLLPPEIAQGRRLRTVQLGLGAGVVGCLAAVGLGWLLASGSAASAQASLDQASATGTQLQTQVAGYRDVTTTYAATAQAHALLVTAMGSEVRWSRLLEDLSLNVPQHVWVKSVTFTEPGPTAGTAATGAVPAAGAAAPGEVAGPGSAGSPGGPARPAAASAASIGSVTFTGTGFSHDDVAAWLEALAQQPGYAAPTFSSSTEALLGPKKVVQFTSSVTLTPAALSGRYTASGE